MLAPAPQPDAMPVARVLSEVIRLDHVGQVDFGFGARRLLPAALRDAGIARPLFVTDANLLENGVFAAATEALAAPPIVFGGCRSNPDVGTVAAARRLYEAEACDGVVAVGGGSNIDCAKAVALLVTHEGPMERFEGPGGAAFITGRIAPVIAMPTTAGTGSEVGRGMGITLADGTKGVFRSRHLVPPRALCDPELTLGLPPVLTAGTAADSLAHCLEALISGRLNPLVDPVAFSGVRRIARHVGRATLDRSDRVARWHMMMGAVEGGVALWKGAGFAHATSVALDELDLHHGTLVAIATVPCLEAQLGGLDGRERLLKQALGIDEAADVCQFLADLFESVGLPSSLRAFGVDRIDIDRFAGVAARSSFNSNFHTSWNAGQYARILEKCMH